MPYRTILVHLDQGPGNAARLRLAATLAARSNGHLFGTAFTGLSRHLHHDMPPEQDDPTLATHLAMLRDQARAGLNGFEEQCAKAGLASFEARLVDDEPADGLSLLARGADVVVIGQASADAKAAAAALPVHVITHSGRPVLLVPPAWAGSECGQRIVVSWDASREAARAVQLALPLLAQAGYVELVVFDAGANTPTVANAFAADPRPWLARHGVQARMAVHAVEKRRGAQRRHEVGEALLMRASDVGADLLVMGAYGHSRFRESILGGVSKTVLEAMTLPVLMAH